MELSLNI